MSQATRMVTAIQMKHLADLDAVAKTLSDKNPSAIIGYVVGHANGVGFRAAFDTESGPSIGLVGAFQGIPVDETMPILTGPMFFPPKAFAEMAQAELLRGVPDKNIPKKAPAKGKGVNVAGIAEMEIKLEISVERNVGGGVLYKFAVTQHGSANATDPFAAMRDFIPKEIAGKMQLALPAPSKPKGKSKK